MLHEIWHKHHPLCAKLLPTPTAKEADENGRWSYQSIRHYVAGHKAVDSRSRPCSGTDLGVSVLKNTARVHKIRCCVSVERRAVCCRHQLQRCCMYNTRKEDLPRGADDLTFALTNSLTGGCLLSILLQVCPRHKQPQNFARGDSLRVQVLGKGTKAGGGGSVSTGGGRAAAYTGTSAGAVAGTKAGMCACETFIR